MKGTIVWAGLSYSRNYCPAVMLASVNMGVLYAEAVKWLPNQGMWFSLIIKRKNSGPTQVAKGIFIEEIYLLNKVLWDLAPILGNMFNETGLVFYL